MAASPAVAERISVGQFHFVEKQSIYLTIALLVIITFSLVNESTVKKIIFFGFLMTTVMLVAVLFFGDETKGAKRWLNFLGFSLQPSEFLKPFYSSIVAVILAKKKCSSELKSFCYLVAGHAVIILLLLLQPDFGMAILISTVFVIQLFIAGANVIWLLGLGGIFLGGCVLVYYTLPHVAKRVEQFLQSDGGETNYQVQRSLESYCRGGLWGRGPGEGVVKYKLPDAHADFIFSVAAEELGLVFCIITVLLMLYIVVKGFSNLAQIKYGKYKVFTGVGIMSYFAIQSLFNIAVTLNLVPTKGMTLPFISYGGSSLIAQAILFGIYLNITKTTYPPGLQQRPIHAKF